MAATDGRADDGSIWMDQRAISSTVGVEVGVALTGTGTCGDGLGARQSVWLAEVRETGQVNGEQSNWPRADGSEGVFFHAMSSGSGWW
jgi:hypothetical protein